jgi:hypothetical protein
MGFKTVLVASLAASVSAIPIMNPIQMMRSAGPEAGKVISIYIWNVHWI